MTAPNVDEIRKRLAKIKAQAFQALDLASNQTNCPDSDNQANQIHQSATLLLHFGYETRCHLLVHIY